VNIRHLLLACALIIPPVQADTLRIVEFADLGIPSKEESPSVLALPWNEEGQVLFPSVRGTAILEAYVIAPVSGETYAPLPRMKVALRLKDEQAVSGFVDTPAPDDDIKRLKPFPFQFNPSKYPAATEEAFAAARKDHDTRLARSGLPGSAWYRHRAGVIPADPNRVTPGGDFDSTFRMASGGRAIAENLALDRDLILASGEKGEAVDIATLKGITVPAIDWTGKLKPGEVKIDPAAMFIPEDQHALITPSLAALLELRDVVDKEGAPILQSYDVRNPYQGLVARYQEQMGIANLDFIAKTLDLGSVAITGSDPFFATGTDLALIFSTEKQDAVFDAFALALSLKAKLAGVAMKEQDGIRSYQTEDRALSVHLAKFDGAVVISNSLSQVQRIASVAKKETPALGSTDEYKFFRQRYPVNPAEDAYLFLSDATIRRWCSPAVRIAASRRTRAFAALGELAAAKLEGKPAAETYADLLGKVTDAGASPDSEIFNTLGFLTPSSELAIKTASPAEANAYNRWREGYESGWRRVFDPIALRLRMEGPKRELDLSVLPLTVDSSYRRWMEITGTGKPKEGAPAAHEKAKAFLSFNIDTESEAFRRLGEQSVQILPSLKANALGWVGGSISLYLDESFFWTALTRGNAKTLLDMNYLRLPLGVRIDSRSSVQLAVFITAIRSYIEESAPNLLRWEQRKHGETAYLAVLSKEEEEENPLSPAIYYAALKGALLISLDERVLKDAIDREEKEKKAVATGHHVQATLDGSSATLLGMVGENRLDRQRLESWAALPILNEWHRRESQKDPVALHAAIFREDIRCPGGKGYRWNEAACTMESVAFGFPADPRGEEVKFASAPVRFGAGLRFEDGGLRLQATMEPEPAREEKAADDQAGIEVPDGFPQVKDLALLPEGLELTYAVDETDADGPYTKTITRQASEETDKGTIIRTRTRIDAEGEEDDSTSNEEYLIAKDGSGLGMTGLKSDLLVRTFGRPMPVLPAKLAPGIRFGGNYDSVAIHENETSKDGGLLRARVIGLEKVEVPAGTFENCVRIDGEYDYLSGVQIGRVSDTIWYAPGIGIVKSAWKTEFGHGTELLQKVVKP
jgi:hypothetical protein